VVAGLALRGPGWNQRFAHHDRQPEASSKCVTKAFKIGNVGRSFPIYGNKFKARTFEQCIFRFLGMLCIGPSVRISSKHVAPLEGVNT
jgi:hypothetical protein